MNITRLLTVTALTLLPSAALAQEQPNLVSKYGVEAMVGAGVTGFLDSDTRSYASAGGSWEARFIGGSREWIAVEAAYVGTAQAIDALGLDSSAVLLGTGVEGALHVNLMRGPVQPYVLAGAGWTRYDITNSNFNTSDVADSDNTFEMPLGLGVSYRYQHLILDARAVVRPVFDNDLINGNAVGHDTRLDNLSGMIHGGFEF